MGRWRVPDILIGIILTVAAFSLGWSFAELSQAHNADGQTDSGKQEHSNSLADLAWEWVSKPDGYIALGTLVLALYTFRLVADGREHNRRSLRAYVGIHHADIEWKPLHMQASEFIVRLNFRNSGGTPAYRFRTWGQVGVNNAKGFIFPDPIPANPTSILFSESSVNVVHVFKPPIEVTQDIRHGRIQMAVWGRVDFEDAFGEQRSFIFRMISGEVDPENGRYPLSPHGKGYEAN